jgi:hypothetical protein
MDLQACGNKRPDHRFIDAEMKEQQPVPFLVPGKFACGHGPGTMTGSGQYFFDQHAGLKIGEK